MEPLDKQNTARILFLVLAVICITFLHYRTGHLHIASHILFRELYFLPIILAGFWFGMEGALIVSLSVSVLYLPYILSLPEGIAGHNLGNIMQVVIFNILGLLVGWLRNREKKQQRHRLEDESLAAMGRAVSCIAHDMKTPLMAIGGLVRQVRRRTEEKGLADKLELATTQVRRLEALVGDMLAFARPLQLQCRQGAVTDLIQDVMLIAEEKALQREVRFRTDMQREMPLLDYDSGRLQQALLNLVNNAIEASPRGGEVTIRCHCEKGGIVIEVADQGEGVPEELVKDIFSPFVTTKKEGTGLGLPIVKKVIEAHAGSIILERNLDKGGTIFRVFLPISRTGNG